MLIHTLSMIATFAVWIVFSLPAFFFFFGNVIPIDTQQVRNTTEDVVAVAELAQREKFIFKIETKSGGIVGNILIEGKGLFDCIRKLKQRYPGCTVLESRKK